MDYCFIPYEEKKGIIHIDRVNDSRNLIPDIFLNDRVEVVYIVGEERHLFGVVTPSDLDRLYYSEVSKPEEIINRKFKFLKENNFDSASEFFKKYKKCHEVPVVLDGRLTGVIFDGIGKDEAEWESITTVINTRKRMEADIRWYCENIRKSTGEWHKNHLLIYGNLRDNDVFDKFDDAEKTELLKRKRLSNKEIHNTVLNKRWNEPEFFDDYDSIHIISDRGVMVPADIKSKSFNIVNHKRIVINAPNVAKRRIFMFGPCNVFGAYVTDDKTIETYLQRLCIENGFSDVEVVNCGLMGPEKCLDRIFISQINSNDLIIIITPGFDWVFKEFFPESYRGCLSGVYFDLQKPLEHFLDNVRHCDGEVNKSVAGRIWNDLRTFLYDVSLRNYTLFNNKYFVSRDVIRWFDKYFETYFDGFYIDGIIGAIVMNCNPFTYGHRYLIEYASERVDHLIIFVVQEDKSFFSFEKRLEMVKRGTEDLDNITVVPSGKYIISKDTFAQYFEKDSAIEVEDMDYDIFLFGEIVAGRLGINVRFVGEEPSDRVTARYKMRE